MTTADRIDMPNMPKHPQAALYPSETVTLAILSLVGA